MNVHECPQCGSYLRFGGDPHECGPRDDSRIRYNLVTTDEEKAALSESVRLLYGIDEAFWYRNRPKVLAIVQRLRRDGHPDPKVMACIHQGSRRQASGDSGAAAPSSEASHS
ncbi:hypothetical protein SH661x_004383 [Planctomicrobium sp. SH661]|uniref:hypothetical protein n=1 Tax=Planctomicrobium sp. SH661 TaxID=3448124 RepID=UPI003F5BF556